MCIYSCCVCVCECAYIHVVCVCVCSLLPTVGSAAVLPPELFLNLRFPREPADQAAVTPSQFINVIDLEDSVVLQELPSRPQPSPPTSAELHLLAASVTNSARPQLPTASTSSEDKVPQDSPGRQGHTRHVQVFVFDMSVD